MAMHVLHCPYCSGEDITPIVDVPWVAMTPANVDTKTIELVEYVCADDGSRFWAEK